MYLNSCFEPSDQTHTSSAVGLPVLIQISSCSSQKTQAPNVIHIVFYGNLCDKKFIPTIKLTSRVVDFWADNRKVL